jgi:hypothetical protein
MLARLIHAAAYLLAGLALLGLSIGSIGLVYLGCVHPPPYVAWARQGLVGVLAAAALMLGTGLWAGLVVATLVWAVRWLRSAVAALLGSPR